MTTIEILVEGKVTLTGVMDVRADGTLWSRGDPVINGFLLAEKGISKEEFHAARMVGKITPKMLTCCMKLGDNPGGRFARDKSAADRILAEDRERNATPADRERHAISMLFARAERCDRSEDDVEYRRLRGDAFARLEAWKRDYPEAANHDRAERIRHRAENERRLAAGAMFYDSDGTLSYEDQCRRRDEMLATAARLEAEADAVEAGAR